MKLTTVPEMVAVDRRTIDGGFVPSLDLMEAAGRGIAAIVVEELGATAGCTPSSGSFYPKAKTA